MRRITATYRLQFGEGTTFDDAGALAPYLASLGVSHLYASPVFEARSGSTHGYDVTDPNALRGSFGGRAGFDRMVAALHEQGLGLILDIVPNHMAASPENPWLWDVLAKGRASDHAATFDIDWDKSGGKVVLPILGTPLAEVLAAGELSVRDGRLAYYETELPLAEGTGEGEVADVLARQHYELSFWRDLHRLNYRRFFDITDLIGVRMEDEAVFDRSHRLIGELVASGAVDGLRVDHVDGMRDPKGYLDRLSGLFPNREQAAIWVEKIVEGAERLPASWPVLGETGYAVMAWLDGVFVDTDAEAAFTDLYRALTGDRRDFHAVEAAAKREVVDGPFAHEFAALAEKVAGAAGVPTDDARAVLETVARAFPVYRTYLPAEGEADRLRGYAEPARDLPGFDAVMGVLTDPARPEALTFQQMTGPVTAKAVEDTSFYRWHRWSMLNEVGGDPSVFGRTTEAFHARMTERMAEPLALSATATHDTKRGEDTRARLAAATHEPDFWAEQARAWWAEARDAREGVAPVTAYLLFQTIVGFWDEDARDTLADRLAEYALKAARERKRDTSWTEQDEDYEGRLTALARAACAGRLGEIAAATAARLDEAGRGIAVARTVLKAAIPGVPDTYQGREGRDHHLVDPDNRRPVDFGALASALADDPPPKLAATAAMLRLRRDHPDLFEHGSYEPRDAPPGVLAFARSHEGRTLLVAVATRPGAALPDLPGEAVLDEPTARVTLA